MNARDYDKLKSLGIEQILTVGIDLEPHENDRFRTYKIDVSDVENENISMYFSTASKFISGGKTLVHCRAGVSRSASIVIAHLMATRRWSVNRAIQYVRQRRAIIKPNPGFIKQLIEYQKLLERDSQQKVSM
jgi:protein-tyrosine phosphatase